jgi:hypothetical protein
MIHSAMLSVATPLVMCSCLSRMFQLQDTHIQWKSGIKLPSQLWNAEEWINGKSTCSLVTCCYCKKILCIFNGNFASASINVIPNPTANNLFFEVHHTTQYADAYQFSWEKG